MSLQGSCIPSLKGYVNCSDLRSPEKDKCISCLMERQKGGSRELQECQSCLRTWEVYGGSPHITHLQAREGQEGDYSMICGLLGTLQKTSYLRIL